MSSTPVTPKTTQQQTTQSETMRDGRQIVYETDDERKERLRLERLGDMIEERLNKVLDERDCANEKRRKKEKNLFDDLFS